jgi:hypothetical protein
MYRRIVLKKRTLVGPSDLSSGEVPEESGRRIEAVIYIEKTGELAGKGCYIVVALQWSRSYKYIIYL